MACTSCLPISIPQAYSLGTFSGGLTSPASVTLQGPASVSVTSYPASLGALGTFGTFGTSSGFYGGTLGASVVSGQSVATPRLIGASYPSGGSFGYPGFAGSSGLVSSSNLIGGGVFGSGTNWGSVLGGGSFEGGVVGNGLGYGLVGSSFGLGAPTYISGGTLAAPTFPAAYSSVAAAIPPTYTSASSSVPVTTFPVTSTSYEMRSMPAAAPISGSITSSSYSTYSPCQPRPTVFIATQPAPPPQKEVEIRTIEVGQEKVRAMEEELFGVRHQLTLAEDTQERLRKQLQEAQAKVKFWASKEGQVGTLEAEIARLKEQVFEGDLKLVNSEGQRAGAAEAAAKLERELQIAHERLGKLGHVEGELQAANAALLETRQRLANVEAESARYQSGMSSLEAQLGESQDRLFQIKNGFESERTSMRQQVEDMQARLRLAEQQRDDALKQVSFFEMKIKEAESRLLSGDQTVAQMRAQWEFERVQLKDQLLEAQNQLATFEKQRIEYVNKINFLEAKLRETESKLSAAEARIQTLQARIQALELELTNLRARLSAKPDLHTSSRTTETYKVKSFEIAAKLAKMDGTDDGLYNGLPIEVEGEGLYRDLVARGRKPKYDPSQASLTAAGTFGTSSTTSTETYKVNSYEMAERLSKMDGTDDGLYNGLPIEVVGEGLYRELRVKRGWVAGGGAAWSAGSSTTTTTVSGGGGGSSTTTSSETYKVNSYEMAERLSKMSGKDDGTYNGLAIEVAGEGLYRELRVKRGWVAGASSGAASAGATTRSTVVSGGASGVTSGAVTGGDTYIVTSFEIAQTLSKMTPGDDGTYKGLPIEIKGQGLYRDLRGKK